MSAGLCHVEASQTKSKRFRAINSVDHVWLGGIKTTLCTLLIYYKAIYHELNLLLSVQCTKRETTSSFIFFITILSVLHEDDSLHNFPISCN